jgi:2-dehydro-3-deoxygalactonokinase
MTDRPPARAVAETWAIALDGGTTNTRARLIKGGRVVATSRRAVGVRDTVLGAAPASGPPARDSSTPGQPHRARLVQAVREVVAEVGRDLVPSPGPGGAVGPVEFLIAAGMLSSEVGLLAVPHLPAPASLDDLTQAMAVTTIAEIVDLPIYVVPGIRTPAADGPDGWFEADVMRGEECETWGAYLMLRAAGRIEPGQETVFLWPGSHTKLVEVDAAGRITRSHTTLAGELLQAAAQHTLLAASLPETLPEEVDPDAAAAGARAVARSGPGRAAFLVRIAALTGSLDPHGRASFWIGASVAADGLALVRHPILCPGRPVWVGGRQPLRSLYAADLAGRHAGPVVPLEEPLAESASAVGAWEIAVRRKSLDGPSR